MIKVVDAAVQKAYNGQRSIAWMASQAKTVTYDFSHLMAALSSPVRPLARR